MGRERLRGDGRRREFVKGMGVLGRVRRGNVFHAEHGHDTVPSKGSLCKGMG